MNWGTTYQVVDGFGAAATGYVSGFTQQQVDQFFDAETGLGLSLLRIRPIADTQDTDCWCVANNPHYECVKSSNSQIVSGDLQIAKAAFAKGVRIFATPWSPPAEMKSSGKYCSGGAMNGNPANYTKYAAELANFLSLLRENGVSIEALSVQNEPDVESTYDTCRWTAQQIHDFIPILSKALKDANFANVVIAAPEQSSWEFDLMNESMNDPSVADKIGLVLGHAYDSENPSGLPAVGRRHVWQTEVGDSSKFDGGMADGLRWARSIHDYMTVGANAWMYWSLDCGEKYFEHNNNMCLTDSKNNLAKRAYVLGQYAKFIRPGWQRVGTANRGALLVTAYKGPENRFAVVVVNADFKSVRNQEFDFKGMASDASGVTPWLTSASASLAKQPSVSVASDRASFTYTIPANSVVTFAGKGN